MKKHRVLIAEDHTILREGLRALLSRNENIVIAGEVENGREAVRRAVDLRPDLVLMDLSMPGTNGMEAIRQIKQRDRGIKVLVLTVHRTDEYIHATLQAGADGYILKDATSEELMLAIGSVMSGKTYLCPGISARVINRYLDGGRASEACSSWEALTYREREVLKLIAEGQQNKRIADYLCISVKTVEKHRSNLMKKLDLHNIAALTAFAIDRGLVAR